MLEWLNGYGLWVMEGVNGTIHLSILNSQFLIFNFQFSIFNSQFSILNSPYVCSEGV